MYSLCLHYLQHTQDAQDVTQEVFVTVHQSLHQFQHQSALSTWIYRIAVNKCIDHLRSRKRKRRLGLLFSVFGSDDNTWDGAPHFDHPGVLAEQKESMSRLFECINALPENYKTVIILSKMMKKSQVEVAEIMGSTPKAVESLLQRAKLALQKKINQTEGN